MKKTALIDLGGNYVNYAKDGCLDIHCCSPIIDHRDSARENERGCELDALVEAKDGRKKITSALRNRYMYPERPLREGQLNVRCKKLCQDCDVQAPAGFSVHGTYDMRITELLQTLDRHGIGRFSALIHFDMDILMSTEGVMQSLNCKFKKFVDETGVERIRFNFVGDTSTGFVHRLDTYLSLLFLNIAVSPKGIAYQFERGDSRCGSMIINITRCDAKPMIDTCQYYFSH
jgi:Viral methyltransferase